MDPHALVEERTAALRRFHGIVGTNRSQLDLSGGVDSAVVLGLLARALGPESITAVHSAIHSHGSSLALAREAAAAFGVRLVELDLTAAFEQIRESVLAALARSGRPLGEIEARMERDPAIEGSFRSTLRAPVGRFCNRLAGDGIRHGTGNECEDRWVRFYQKGGDGEVDTNPIGMLAKGEVYQLGRALGVPDSILGAMPTPDLWASGPQGHNDEEELLTFLDLPKDTGHTMYSYLGENGQGYARVGLIERVARFLDRPWQGGIVEEALFGDDVMAGELDAVCEAGRSSTCFAGVEPGMTESLLRTARRIEGRTRHKENPNIPMLGDRGVLLRAGILTDTLPRCDGAAGAGADGGRGEVGR